MITAKTYPVRTLKWFHDHIGKRVWPNSPTCYCDVCVAARFQGIVISDRDTAERLYQYQYKKGIKYSSQPWFLYN